MTRFTSLITRSLVTLLMAGGALATSLHAQSDEAITVRVPFPFTLGTQSMAAGTYQFSLPTSHFTLAVLNVKTRDMEMFNVHPEQESAIAQEGRLVFRNTDDGSDLNEIHFPGTGMFSEVVERRNSGRMEGKSSTPDGSITIAER
jgi:hypothetical protein